MGVTATDHQAFWRQARLTLDQGPDGVGHGQGDADQITGDHDHGVAVLLDRHGAGPEPVTDADAVAAAEGPEAAQLDPDPRRDVLSAKTNAHRELPPELRASDSGRADTIASEGRKPPRPALQGCFKKETPARSGRRLPWPRLPPWNPRCLARFRAGSRYPPSARPQRRRKPRLGRCGPPAPRRRPPGKRNGPACVSVQATSR